MPSFVITSPQYRSAKTNALFCDPNGLGYPDQRNGVPVKATITEKEIWIDDEVRPRLIISSVGMNGTGTYLVDGSTR